MLIPCGTNFSLQLRLPKLQTKVCTTLGTWLGIVALILQMNAVPLDYVLFRLNQQEITRMLCEHKMPHCNGHCYLMKQIAKAATANAEKRAERFGFQLSGQYLSSGSNIISLDLRENWFGSHSFVDNLLIGFHTTVDQPPRAI